MGIVDDRWLTVGSANLNAHSLLNDTEMNVVTDDPELARDTRLRLWAEHLELEPEAIADDAPGTVVDERWRPIAAEQLQRLRAGQPATHRLWRSRAYRGDRAGFSARWPGWSTADPSRRALS